MTWTTDHVAKLAPDASSLSAARGLATVSKWPTLGRSDAALWGECQGSGKKPYQARIDLSEPAFKCSCPSRKFPCKHALALFLIFAESPDSLREGEEPGWVADWLASRRDRAEKKAAASPKKAPDPKAKARREAQRGARVDAGLELLERWILDLIDEGLGAAQARPASSWDEITRSLVDAQCAGLARQVWALQDSTSGEGWQRRFLDDLSRLWLLVRAGRCRASLEPALRHEVNALIGFSVSKDDVLENGERIESTWHVVGQVVESDDRLQSQRTWLWSEQAQRTALVLDFAPHGRPLDTSLMSGSSFEGSVAFYEGAARVRALVAEKRSAAPTIGALGDETLTQAWERAGGVLARSPWRLPMAMVVRGIRPCRMNESWGLVDAHERCAPLSDRFSQLWRLLAVSGGHPINMCAEWDGETLTPLSAWNDEAFCDLTLGDAA